MPRPDQPVHRQPPQVAAAQLAHHDQIERGVESGPRRRTDPIAPQVRVRMLVRHGEIGRAKRRTLRAHGHPGGQGEAVAPQHPQRCEHDAEVAWPGRIGPQRARLLHQPHGLRVDTETGGEREPPPVQHTQANRPGAARGDGTGEHTGGAARLVGGSELAREHRRRPRGQESGCHRGRHAVHDLVGGAVPSHGDADACTLRSGELAGMTGPFGESHLDVGHLPEGVRHIGHQQLGHPRGHRVHDQAQPHRAGTIPGWTLRPFERMRSPPASRRRWSCWPIWRWSGTAPAGTRRGGRSRSSTASRWRPSWRCCWRPAASRCTSRAGRAGPSPTPSPSRARSPCWPTWPGCGATAATPCGSSASRQRTSWHWERSGEPRCWPGGSRDGFSHPPPMQPTAGQSPGNRTQAMSNMLKSSGLLLAAVLSGAITALWVDSTHPQSTTIVRTETIAAPQTVASAPTSAGLDATQGYRRAARGVGVFRPNAGLGTGFVIDSDGHVLTNAHVVVDATTVDFELPRTLAGGEIETYPAKVLGLDKSTDVAVLQIDAPADKLHPLALAARGNRPVVGEPVVAIGTPLGEEGTVTTGIVSAVSREIDSLTPNVKIYGAIQTDAAINHGNSGGPLLNGEGQVIGINSQILSENNGNIGIGFAIPISTARDVADQIISTGKVAHAWLGIEGNELTANVAKALSLSVQQGVLVGQVVNGSPADKAGLHGVATSVTVEGQSIMSGGDVIVTIDGTQIHTFADLAETIARHSPGDTIPLQVLRGGNTMTVQVTLGKR